MTLESVHDVYRASGREFAFICRHPDEEMADCFGGLISAWTCCFQYVFAHYRTLEDCLYGSSFFID